MRNYKKFNNEKKLFTEELIKSGGNVLDEIVNGKGNKMIYYRLKNSLVTDIKTKVFN